MLFYLLRCFDINGLLFKNKLFEFLVMWWKFRRPIFWMTHSSSHHWTLSSKHTIDLNNRIYLWLSFTHWSIKIIFVANHYQTFVSRFILRILVFLLFSSLLLRIWAHFFHKTHCWVIWIYILRMLIRISPDKKRFLAISLVLKFDDIFVSYWLVILLNWIRLFSPHKSRILWFKLYVFIKDVSRSMWFQNDGGEMCFGIDDDIRRLH